MGRQTPDRDGASRAVAYLMLASAPYVFVTGVVLPSHLPAVERATVAATTLLLALCGAVCWRAPGRIPAGFFSAVPFIATVVIVFLNVLTDDASTGAQLFFLWPILYAAMYLRGRWVYAVLAAVFAGEGANVFLVFDDVGRAWADWTSMMLAMSMSCIVAMTLRERANQLMRVLKDQALADPLTGLPNRRALDLELARADASLRRDGGSLALLSVDLDRFKDINDTWGHAAGDLALQAVASALRRVARETDVVARLGGDEFVLLVRGDRQEAVEVAGALRASVAGCTTVPGGPPGLSIGIAVLPDDAGSIQDLLAASDAALYRAKTGGRARATADPDGTSSPQHGREGTVPASTSSLGS